MGYGGEVGLDVVVLDGEGGEKGVGVWDGMVGREDEWWGFGWDMSGGACFGFRSMVG